MAEHAGFSKLGERLEEWQSFAAEIAEFCSFSSRLPRVAKRIRGCDGKYNTPRLRAP